MVARPQDEVGVHGVQPGVVLVEAEVAAAVSAGPVFEWDKDLMFGVLLEKNFPIAPL